MRPRLRENRVLQTGDRLALRGRDLCQRLTGPQLRHELRRSQAEVLRDRRAGERAAVVAETAAAIPEAGRVHERIELRVQSHEEGIAFGSGHASRRDVLVDVRRRLRLYRGL